MASAIAVLPVPEPPAKRTARPDIFLDRIKSTRTPAASRAFSRRVRLGSDFINFCEFLYMYVVCTSGVAGTQ